jgi:hypothetical protein
MRRNLKRVGALVLLGLTIAFGINWGSQQVRQHTINQQLAPDPGGSGGGGNGGG